MIRKTFIIPGNDCIYGVCRSPGCPGYPLHHPKSHGIRGETWLYVVREGEPGMTLADATGPALSLSVATDLYPDTVPEAHAAWRAEAPLAERRKGISAALHRPLPINLHGHLEHEDCIVLAGRPCRIDGASILVAYELFRDHGDPAESEQPEGFWAALESLFTKWRTE